ncbi:hypothetical protein [Lactobacillus crispatus]|uniref:hypothetical protein n=1 Tax=Lactobacillus crispatus TaxID=47770 RepID=UPI00214EFA01|nr:hypothetical protein [Lactobacillus crispatus]
MENTNKWSNKKGHWFEDYVIEFLKQSGYSIEKKKNTISDKSGKKEIDIILIDDDQAYGNCQIFCVNSSFSQIDFLIIYLIKVGF